MCIGIEFSDEIGGGAGGDIAIVHEKCLTPRRNGCGGHQISTKYEQVPDKQYDIDRNMDLTKINETSTLAGLKPAVKLRELPSNGPHLILGAKITKGKFWESVLLELEKNVVFLPGRVTEGFKIQIDKFEAAKYTVTFTGLEEGNFHPATKFLIKEV
ncbi:unnamed protein product [Acanthoscelides obtectus]|uniref:Uncharacterized protein n=1 Tax=Acanthoscelides obtectus TaxID=200917 RepID=A0A9P0KER3_ACAOB|nr:unnamed protein product [Acanthoscelides obtectus]CAK1669292.1 hypothetical protein AOBTE_LOCUS26933 [Acanthoscelides obtectus]